MSTFLRFHSHLVLITLLLAGCKNEHPAIAKLNHTAQANVSIKGMFSLQSDWHRTFTIKNNGRSIARKLIQDTGWWRGSQLYSTEDGLYILDEGQGGCLAFRLDPLEFDDRAAKCATRRSAAPVRMTSNAPERLASHVYPGLVYLGRFSEIHGDHAGLEFFIADTTPEITLPTPP